MLWKWGIEFALSVSHYSGKKVTNFKMWSHLPCRHFLGASLQHSSKCLTSCWHLNTGRYINSSIKTHPRAGKTTPSPVTTTPPIPLHSLPARGPCCPIPAFDQSHVLIESGYSSLAGTLCWRLQVLGTVRGRLCVHSVGKAVWALCLVPSSQLFRVVAH